MGISATLRGAAAGAVLAGAVTSSVTLMPAIAAGTQTPPALGNYIVTLEPGTTDVVATADSLDARHGGESGGVRRGEPRRVALQGVLEHLARLAAQAQLLELVLATPAPTRAGAGTARTGGGDDRAPGSSTAASASPRSAASATGPGR